jgi:hypothetical protein
MEKKQVSADPTHHGLGDAQNGIRGKGCINRRPAFAKSVRRPAVQGNGSSPLSPDP